MAQMREYADTYIRLVKVARGVVESKGAAGLVRCVCWEIAPSRYVSAWKRGGFCQTKPISLTLGGPRARAQSRSIKAAQACTRPHKPENFSQGSLDSGIVSTLTTPTPMNLPRTSRRSFLKSTLAAGVAP